MRALSREHLTKRLRDFRVGLRHAFATQPASQHLSMEDVGLMERMAEVIVKRGMAAPATLFLESMGPMSFLGSQALHFFTPIIDVAFNAKEVEQVARLLERRDSAARLIALIEAQSGTMRASAQ
jgi:hypothetical protein